MYLYFSGTEDEANRLIKELCTITTMTEMLQYIGYDNIELKLDGEKVEISFDLRKEQKDGTC